MRTQCVAYSEVRLGHGDGFPHHEDQNQLPGIGVLFRTRRLRNASRANKRYQPQHHTLYRPMQVNLLEEAQRPELPATCIIPSKFLKGCWIP